MHKDDLTKKGGQDMNRPKDTGTRGNIGPESGRSDLGQTGGSRTIPVSGGNLDRDKSKDTESMGSTVRDEFDEDMPKKR